MYVYKIKNTIDFTVKQGDSDNTLIITIKFGNRALKTHVFRNNDGVFEYISTNISEDNTYIKLRENSGWVYILNHAFREDIENKVFYMHFYTVCTKTFDTYQCTIEINHPHLHKTTFLDVLYVDDGETVIREHGCNIDENSKWYAILEHIVEDTMDIHDRVTIYP